MPLGFLPRRLFLFLGRHIRWQCQGRSPCNSPLNHGPAGGRSGQGVPAAANGPRAKGGNGGPQRRHAGDHAARRVVGCRGGPGQEPGGCREVQDFHRQLFANSCEPLRQEIKRITGVDVRESVAEVEPSTGTVVQVFSSGTMVQVFLLAHGLPAETWNGTGPVGPVKTD